MTECVYLFSLCCNTTIFWFCTSASPRTLFFHSKMMPKAFLWTLKYYWNGTASSKIVIPAPCPLTTTYPYIHFFKYTHIVFWNIIQSWFSSPPAHILSHPHQLPFVINSLLLSLRFTGYVAITTALWRASAPLLISSFISSSEKLLAISDELSHCLTHACIRAG